MALGTSSFPSVSTGFTSDSKAMVPVSIQGVGGQLQKCHLLIPCKRFSLI